ncbi:MAG TPA: cytidine deaminase, partial [Desulfobacteraceae bacterium]|nr:cytidine deaminase [Desulfobacteraceae bacterium]
AEQNAIIQAALHGVSIKGAVLFCTNQPCSICTKMIINAGIKKIYYSFAYTDSMADEMLKQAGIELIKIERSRPE